MNNKEVIGVGMVTIELGIGVWIYNRFVKRRKQTKEISAVSDDVVNETETTMLQTFISQKRTRTRITSGMIRKWSMMAKRGMSHKQIAAEYGVSLVSVDRHLARLGRKKSAKADKAYSTVPMIDSEVKNNRLLINKHEL